MKIIKEYTWWGEPIIVFVDQNNTKLYFPERGIDQRYSIGENNPKCESITVGEKEYNLTSIKF